MSWLTTRRQVAPTLRLLAQGNPDTEQAEQGGLEEDSFSSDEDEADKEGSYDEDGSSESSDHGPADWYDVNDGFIDDSEIMDMPEDVAGKTKHDGFFINKVRGAVRIRGAACIADARHACT